MKGPLTRPAIFGGFDGTSSLLGVVVYLLINHPSLILPAALAGAISSALSMGAGEWLSDSENGFSASLMMAVATFTGAILPAVPFAFGHGPAEVADSAVIVALIGIAVAAMRPQRGLGLAMFETFGLLVVILLVTWGCAVAFPSGGAG